MKLLILRAGLLAGLLAANLQLPAQSATTIRYQINGAALCATAKQTLAYLDRGASFDPEVIHSGKLYPVSLQRIRATLRFICQHQAQLNNPAFVQQHFELIHWGRIRLTKYYVHRASASKTPTPAMPHALYRSPKDDALRLQYGKQAILAGALKNKPVDALVYVSRDDLESALLQGTVVATVDDRKIVFNVDKNNNIAWDRQKSPYEQERYWYFKAVDGIKGYGKDSDHKITVYPEATFAADLGNFGLGKLLMVQYPDQSGAMVRRGGIFADTGGAFVNNHHQVDFLTGIFNGRAACMQATRDIPDYVDAWFMVVRT